jgi:hypothetical protein
MGRGGRPGQRSVEQSGVAPASAPIRRGGEQAAPMCSVGGGGRGRGVGGEAAKEAGGEDLGIFQMVKRVSSWPVEGRGKNYGD